MYKIFFLLFSFSLFAQNIEKNKIILYPIYSKKLDYINYFHTKIINLIVLHKGDNLRIMCRVSSIVSYIPQEFELCPQDDLKINLNNLLKFQDNFYNYPGGELPKERYDFDIDNTKDNYPTDDRFRYNLLGKITINKLNNHIDYVFFKFYDFDINNKIFEIKKSIAYLNTKKNNLTTIKEILNVDFLNTKLAKKLYLNKTTAITTKEATDNLINCRFCEEMLLYFEHNRGNYVLNNNSFLGVSVLFNGDEIIEYDNIIKLFKKIGKQGNIYKLLDKKYIIENYEGWKKIVEKEKK